MPAWEAASLENELLLAIGSRVVVVDNEWQEVGIVNGATGIVHDIIYPQGSDGPPDIPEAILVRLDEGYLGPSYLSDENIAKFIPLKKTYDVPRKYEKNDDRAHKKK